MKERIININNLGDVSELQNAILGIVSSEGEISALDIITKCISKYEGNFDGSYIKNMLNSMENRNLLKSRYLRGITGINENNASFSEVFYSLAQEANNP